MKPKQEQIEEMSKKVCGNKDTFAKDLCSCCIAWNDCLEQAQNLYKAGYRKASDVIEEFVERLKQKIYYEFEELIPSLVADKIDELAEEMRQEVEK